MNEHAVNQVTFKAPTEDVSRRQVIIDGVELKMLTEAKVELNPKGLPVVTVSFVADINAGDKS